MRAEEAKQAGLWAEDTGTKKVVRALEGRPRPAKLSRLARSVGNLQPKKVKVERRTRGSGRPLQAALQIAHRHTN